MIKDYLKKKYIKGLTVIYLIVFILCMVMFFASRGKVVYNNNSTHIIPAGNVEENIAENISLTPGLYSAEVVYDLSTSNLYGGFIYVYDDNVRARGLESTGGPLYQGKSTAEAGFKFLDHTDTFRIAIRSFNDDISVSNIRIVNTGKMWTVLAFLSSVIFFSSIVFCIFVNMIQDEKISRERTITVFVMLVTWFLIMLPMFYQNTLSTADDGYHKQRIEGIVAALKAFQIPVRIEPHWVQGYGYANGIFYCDLFLIFPAILRIIGLSVTAAYNWYNSVLCLAILLVSFYSYKRIFKREYVALVLSVLYATSIMRYYKLICTGALGEATAIVFFPLILLGLYEIFYIEKDDSRYRRMSFVHLGIGSAGLVLCHILSTTITIGVIILFILINLGRLFRKKNYLLVIFSGMMAFILSAWFVIPFVEYYFLEDVHIKHVYERTIQFLGLYFPQVITLFYNTYGEKIAYIRGMCHSYPQGIGFLLFLGVAIMIPICICGIIRKKEKISSFSVHMTFLACLFFSFSMIEFPWDKIQSLGGPVKAFVSSIQFPGRFLEWCVVFAIASIGCLLTKLYDENKAKVIKLIIPIFVMLEIIGYMYYHDVNMSSTKMYYIENEEGIGNGYIAGAEYKPEGTDENLCTYNRTDSSEGIIIHKYVHGSLKGVMNIQNTDSEEGWIEYPLLKYRGYRAYDSNGNKFEIVNGFNNVIRVIVPGNYTGEITVKFVSPLYWRLAELLSLAGFVFICVYSAYVKKKRIEEKDIQNEADQKGSFFSFSIWMGLLTAFTLIFSSLPYLTGYVSDGTYINEALAPFIKLENVTGIRAEFFYFPTLTAILFAAYFICLHVVRKAIVFWGIKERENIFVSKISLLVYFTSPIVLYTLYNRIAVWDWVCILLLPAIMGELIIFANRIRQKEFKGMLVDILISAGSLLTSVVCLVLSQGIIRDYDKLVIPLKISKIFDMFPSKGAYNYGLYLANPVQLPVIYLAIICLTTAIFIICKMKKSDDGNKIYKAICALVLPSVALYLFAAVPGIFSMYPGMLLRILGPQSLVAYAGALLVYLIPLFVILLNTVVKDKQYRTIIYIMLIVLVVLSAVYQLNDIAYDSQGIRLVLHMTE